MGDPRKQRKKFSKPAHPWQKERIEEENILSEEYGFKAKKEIWKMKSGLKSLSEQAKNLIALKTAQAEKEKKQLLYKLQSLGLVQKTAQLEDVLGITLKDFLGRRLQTLVYKKGMANSMDQARQFIVHRHIIVAGEKITNPSYLVSKKEEDSIEFSPNSKLSSPDHPERMAKKGEKKRKKKHERASFVRRR